MSQIKAFQLNIVSLNGNVFTGNTQEPLFNVDRIGLVLDNGDGTRTVFQDGINKNTLDRFVVTDTVAGIYAEANATGYTQNGWSIVTFNSINGNVFATPTEGIINSDWVVTPTPINDGGGTFVETKLFFDYKSRRYTNNMTATIAQDWRTLVPPYGNQ